MIADRRIQAGPIPPAPQATMEILAPGTSVLLGDLLATVTAAQIWDGLRVNYHVVWWDGRNRHAEWLDPCEIKAYPRDQPPARIGFRTA